MSLSLCRLSVCTCCDSVIYRCKMDLMLLSSIIILKKFEFEFSILRLQRTFSKNPT